MFVSLVSYPGRQRKVMCAHQVIMKNMVASLTMKLKELYAARHELVEGVVFLPSMTPPVRTVVLPPS